MSSGARPPSPEPRNESYSFGPFRLETRERRLLRDGQPVPLTDKAFDLLEALVKRPGRLLHKEELMHLVWPDAAVEENNLTVTMSALRKALGEGPTDRHYVETVPRHGYRFVADVREVGEREAEGTPHAPAVAESPADEAARPRPFGRPRARLVGITTALIVAVAMGLALWPRHPPAETIAATSSVAVLPFHSLTRGEDEYLGLGMADAVITRLGSTRTVIVRSTGAVREYVRSDLDPLAAGRELGVDAVLEGSIQTAAGRLRATMRLLRVHDGATLWAESFDEPAGDIFSLQDSISERVSKALALRLTEAQRTLLARHDTEDVEAYHLYLKGRYFWNQYNEDGWLQAIQYFRQAIDLDKEYALAWAGLADAYYGLSSLVLLPSEAIPSARAAAERALAIDPDLAEAHAALGVIKEQYDWDPQGAATEYRRALELNPNFAIARERYGVHLFAQGQFEAALVELNKAQELDPLSMVIGFVAVWPLPHLGQDERAIRQLEKLAELFPKVPETRDVLHDARGQMYLRQDRSDAAVTEFLQGSKIKTLCGDDPLTIERLQRAYRAGGLKGYWSTQLEFAVPRYEAAIAAARTRSPQRYVSSIPLAELYARAGDNERALALLQDSYRNRDENLRWLKAESLLPNSPWETVRRDPRFADMLRGMGLDGPAPAPVAAR